MELIDGNEIASAVIEELSGRVAKFGNDKPCVAFVRVGEDPASVSYVRKKERTSFIFFPSRRRSHETEELKRGILANEVFSKHPLVA